MIGPKLTARGRQRARVSAGHGLTKKYPDGTVVTFNTDPLMAAVAHGLLEIARLIGEEAARNAPDDPYWINEEGQRVTQPSPGFGLPHNWGVMGWAFGKLIEAEKVTGNTRLTKPRALKLQQDSVQAIVGFGFPARLQELGSEHHRTQPFLGPAGHAIAGSGEVDRIMRAATARLP